MCSLRTMASLCRFVSSERVLYTFARVNHAMIEHPTRQQHASRSDVAGVYKLER